MKYLLLIFVFFSCTYHDGEEYIDPVLLPYYNTFKYEAERLGVQLPNKGVLICFDDIKANGKCDWNKHYCNIKINPNLFEPDDYNNYSYRIEATIFHELGHGLLHRHHVENTTLIEISLMATHHNGRVHWIDGTMREYYLKELFQIN